MRFLLVLILLLTLGPQARAQDDGVQAHAQDGRAVFAGGNFWTLQAMFDQLPGVVRTVVGYTGGREANASFAQVAHGKTGHRFAVLVIYDPRILPYEQLLRAFWRNIDPVDSKGQFCDRGRQYTSAIYVMTPAQLRAAEDAKMLMETDNTYLHDENGNEIRVGTEILPAGPFYPAEIGQQRYYEKNPLRYRFYQWRCGREPRLYGIWGKPRT